MDRSLAVSVDRCGSVTCFVDRSLYWLVVVSPGLEGQLLWAGRCGSAAEACLLCIDCCVD